MHGCCASCPALLTAPPAPLPACCLYRHPGPPVLQRNVQMYNRLPDYQLGRLAVTLLVGFIFGSLAWGQGDNS